MKIAGISQLPLQPEQAYTFLQNPVVVAKCIPGCQRLDRTDDGEYAMRMKIRMAMVSGQFDGTLRITDRAPTASFRMAVEGSGKIGFMKGEGRITVAGAEGGSSVHYEGEVQVGGLIANVGQRLIETSAKMAIKRFFDAMAAEARTISMGA
jgi:carbon monoxide dehydrogenase subunit G